MIALSSSSAVIIGKSIGVGNEERIRSDARTLSVIDVTTGAVLGLLLFLLRHPLLSMYNLSDEAMVLADHLIIIMSCVMVGMSYQMPVSSGIIQSSGDTKFSMCVNLVSIWCIVMPLSSVLLLCGNYLWKWWFWRFSRISFLKGSRYFYGSGATNGYTGLQNSSKPVYPGRACARPAIKAKIYDFLVFYVISVS